MGCSQVIDVLHPNKATVSKKDLKDILAKEYSVNGQKTENDATGHARCCCCFSTAVTHQRISSGEWRMHVQAAARCWMRCDATDSACSLNGTVAGRSSVRAVLGGAALSPAAMRVSLPVARAGAAAGVAVLCTVL
jgi:hypothetical protein